MSSLSTEQLLLLNNLMYLNSPSVAGRGGDPRTSYDGRTVGELINDININKVENDTISNSEWRSMINQIKSDPTLMNMQIVKPEYDASTGDKHCVFVEPNSNEAVVTFKGTGANEWKDNFTAGNDGDPDCMSVQQERALEYLDSLNLEQYDSVTTTGHSKGGNKAKLCALMNGEVDSCVSFDGQGFSDNFIEKYTDQIAANQHKIQNHNADYDYVNLLLNDVGETTYYEVFDADNFVENHSPDAMFNKDGKLVAVDGQPKEMRDIDWFLNSCLRSMDDEQRAEVLDFLGEAAQTAIGDKDVDKLINDLLLNPKYKDEAAYVLAYALKYEHETGNISESAYYLMDELGFGEFKDYVEVINWALNNETVFGAVRWALDHGEDIPDWVLDFVADKTGLDRDDILYVLELCDEVNDQMDDIEIDENSGKDMKVSDGTEGSGLLDFLEDIKDRVEDWLPDLPMIPLPSPGALLTSQIFVHFEELRRTAELLKQAVEEYERACRQAKDAADVLAASWMGAARDAFVRDQERAFGWYGEMTEIARIAAVAAATSNANYRSAEDKLKSIIGN